MTTSIKRSGVCPEPPPHSPHLYALLGAKRGLLGWEIKATLTQHNRCALYRQGFRMKLNSDLTDDHRCESKFFFFFFYPSGKNESKSISETSLDWATIQWQPRHRKWRAETQSHIKTTLAEQSPCSLNNLIFFLQCLLFLVTISREYLV